MRRQRYAGARWSRSGCACSGPHAPRRGARARIQERNAQRDLAVVELAPRRARTELSVSAGRRLAEGARDRASDLAVRIS